MKVKLAFLQAAVQVPGAFTTETTLSQVKVPGVKMTLEPYGLRIAVKGTVSVVPLTNVKIAILDESETEEVVTVRRKASAQPATI